MSPAEDQDLDQLLLRLEATVSLLAGGTAPLDELVAAHERAVRLLDQAHGRLTELQERVARALQSTAK